MLIQIVVVKSWENKYPEAERWKLESHDIMELKSMQNIGLLVNILKLFSKIIWKKLNSHIIKRKHNDLFKKSSQVQGRHNLLGVMKPKSEVINLKWKFTYGHDVTYQWINSKQIRTDKLRNYPIWVMNESCIAIEISVLVKNQSYYNMVDKSSH